jgi:hypothetical protein
VTTSISMPAVLGADDFDQHAAESRDCNIDQVAYREAGGLEVNADHRSDFEIDEQEQNVSEARAALAAMPMKAAPADQTVVAPIANSAR